MDLGYECSPELRDAVQQRYKHGPGPKLAHSLKVGMRIAIQEIRGNATVSALGYDPLAGKRKAEFDALQSIYQYLEAKGLTWTLACLHEESTVDKSSSNFDLLTIANDPPPQPRARHVPLIVEEEEEEED
jgi:hypothetical protein